MTKKVKDFTVAFIILYVFVTIICGINNIITKQYSYWKEQKTFQEMLACREISYTNNFIVCK